MYLTSGKAPSVAVGFLEYSSLCHEALLKVQVERAVQVSQFLGPCVASDLSWELKSEVFNNISSAKQFSFQRDYPCNATSERLQVLGPPDLFL